MNITIDNDETRVIGTIELKDNELLVKLNKNIKEKEVFNIFSNPCIVPIDVEYDKDTDDFYFKTFSVVSF